jgi:hypothetical protein
MPTYQQANQVHQGYKVSGKRGYFPESYRPWWIGGLPQPDPWRKKIPPKVVGAWSPRSKPAHPPATDSAGEKAKDGPSRAPRDGERCRLDLAFGTIGEWVFDLDGDTIFRAGLSYLRFDSSVK